MKAIFARKIATLEELKKITEVALREGISGQSVTVDEEVLLMDDVFQKFASDMLSDQTWISPKANCIRVVNKETGEKVLLMPEGYEYGRYSSLEII